MPRLATFCPFCEGVNHALRKGPRRDVIRQGQVVFDLDNSMMEKDDDNLAPLPAYEESDAIPPQGTFVLEDDDTELNDQRTPQLLQTSRLGIKQGAAIAPIDRSKSATITPSSTSSTLPTADSLRRSLSKHGGEIVQSDGESSRASRKSNPTNNTDAQASNSKLRKDKSVDISGLTRQYWLRPNDTLMSLCLRFRVNAATLCKLNDLPLSTANTTPHLIHTRQFILIPEGAIQSVLTSSNGNSDGLQSALDGPMAQSRKGKVQRARREAQGRFRAIVAKNDSLGKGKARADNGNLMICDERAAKAYISLMEAELRCIDFGDVLKKTSGEDSEGVEGSDVEEQDAAIDASRRERFNVIVKQAVCRWEMDSDWERQQRAMGIIPTEAIAAKWTPAQSSSNGSGTQSKWLKKLTSSSRKEANRVGWLEKAR